MNDLIRPSLYGSFHKIGEVEQHGRDSKVYDVVGSHLRVGRLPGPGPRTARNRGRRTGWSCTRRAHTVSPCPPTTTPDRAPASCLVDGDKAIVARKRETYEDIIKNEL